MADPLVVGIDSSTTSTKAIAWDAHGAAHAEGRAAIPMSNPRLGRFEQEPEDWWRSTADALSAVTAAVDPARIVGVAIANQRETLATLDADGGSVRPATVWLDERARLEVRDLIADLGADTIQRINGRYPDLTAALYRILWLKRHEPEEFAKVATFSDVQSYLVRRLVGGPPRTSWPSADPIGLVDMTARAYSDTLLAAVGIDASRVPEAVPPGTLLGGVTEDAATATGLRQGTPVFAGGGDGQVAALGAGCTSPDRAYINLGTAVVSGVASPTYLVDRAWRTLIAAQGEGYILENCLRSGTFLLNWFVDQFVPGGRGSEDVYRRLEEEALALPIGSEGVMLQPYWSGAMDPHWDVDARGVIFGLCASHRPAHVYRAILEGVTLDQVARTRSVERAMGHEIDSYVAIGGGASSPLWRQMLADASGKTVHISSTVEATALGAGMIAAAAAGLHPSPEAAAEAMRGTTRPIEPDPAAHARYRRLSDVYAELYGATASINQRLVAFAAEAA